jgi:hypothetical protein
MGDGWCSLMACTNAVVLQKWLASAALSRPGLHAIREIRWIPFRVPSAQRGADRLE